MHIYLILVFGLRVPLRVVISCHLGSSILISIATCLFCYCSRFRDCWSTILGISTSVRKSLACLRKRRWNKLRGSLRLLTPISSGILSRLWHLSFQLLLQFSLIWLLLFIGIKSLVVLKIILDWRWWSDWKLLFIFNSSKSNFLIFWCSITYQLIGLVKSVFIN